MNDILKEFNICKGCESELERDDSVYNDTEIFYKQIWRVDDVARFLGCSKGHIYNLCSDEKIPKRKRGKFLYFVPSEIFEWLIQGENLWQIQKGSL